MNKIDIKKVIRESTAAECRFEFSEAQLESIKTVSGIILVILIFGGAVLLSAMAPNLFIALDKIFGAKRGRRLSNKQKQEKIAHAFYYLKKSGKIKMRPTAGDFKVYLTVRGKDRFQELSFESLKIKKPKFWNGRWWQVAADIPTKKYKRSADALRDKLKRMDFFPLQRTLWLYPHDPRKELQIVLEYYGINRFATVMEVLRVDKDDEKKLKKFFSGKGLI